MNTPQLETRQNTPSQGINQLLVNFMRSAILRSGQEFVCQEVPMTPEMLAQDNGFLPLWMFMASEKLEKLWGPQSLVFHAQEAGTLLQVKFGEQRAMLPTSLWFHALHLVLEETIAKTYEEEFANRRRALQKSEMTGKRVVLDHIVDAWDEAIASRRVVLLPAPASAAMPSSGSM